MRGISKHIESAKSLLEKGKRSFRGIAQAPRRPRARRAQWTRSGARFSAGGIDRVEAETVALGARHVGAGHPVYVVAELSANHLGRFERAEAIVRAAADAGADAVKLQTYTADTLTLDADGAGFRVGGGTPWEGERLYDIYQRAATPWAWHAPLFALARELGLDCFSSPFDPSAVALLEPLEPPAYKIASFELVDLGLIECCARTGRPLVMSTGMATREEIARALAVARDAGASGVALLKCTSAYPAPADALHLRTLRALADDFGVPVGLSDHSLHPEVVVGAVALGASLVERHLTLRRDDGGPDASFSMEPEEFAGMVRSIRLTEAALGAARYGPTDSETATLRFRRSLFAVADIDAGAPFTEDNVRSIRPGDGLEPRHLGEVLRRRARHRIARGTPLRWEHLG